MTNVFIAAHVAGNRFQSIVMLIEFVCFCGLGAFIVISGNDLHTMNEKRFCRGSADTIGAAGCDSSVAFPK